MHQKLKNYSPYLIMNHLKRHLKVGLQCILEKIITPKLKNSPLTHLVLSKFGDDLSGTEITSIVDANPEHAEYVLQNYLSKLDEVQQFSI